MIWLPNNISILLENLSGLLLQSWYPEYVIEYLTDLSTMFEFYDGPSSYLNILFNDFLK